jgi:hypothetical protein
MAITSSNVASKISQNLQNLIKAETSEILAAQSSAQQIQDSNKTAVIGPIIIKKNSETTDDVDYVQNLIDSSGGTGTESSIYQETLGTSKDGDRSIRTEIYPKGQTRADTLVQRDRQSQRLDYEIKEIDNKIAEIQSFKDASNFNVGKTKNELLDERIAAANASAAQSQKILEKLAEEIADSDASIAASEASIFESNKSIAKSNAVILQAEIDEELSSIQTEKFEKVSKQIEEEKSAGNASGQFVNKGEEISNKIQEEKTQGTKSGQFVNQGSKIAKGIQEEKEEGINQGQFVNKGQQIGFDIANEKDAGEKGAQFVNKSKQILDQIESEKGVKNTGTSGAFTDGADRRTLGTSPVGAGSGIFAGQDGGGSGKSFYGDDKKGLGVFKKYTKDNNKINEAKRVSEVENDTTPDIRSMMSGGPNDPYAFSTLSYPPDATNSKENGHFMLFYVNVQNKTKYSYDGLDSSGKVVPVGDVLQKERTVADGPTGKFTRTVVDTFSGASADTGLREAGLISDIEYQKQIVKNGGRGNILYNNQTVLRRSRKGPKTGINSRYPTTTRITDSVALYLPAGIGTSQSANYGDFETGLAGYAVFSGVDIATAFTNDDFVGAAAQAFDKSATLIKDAIKGLSIGLLETLGGGEGLQQSFDKIFGQTLNPYIEVAYQSTGMRTFDYSFKFAPKSKAETEEVKAIIQLFRFHMLPEMKGTSHRYLTLPSTFDIHYMWQSGYGDDAVAKENSFYNKIATCVLTNVGVDYTPNGTVQSFGDGAPTQITMSLSFKETEMMTKQHINEGF